MKRELVEEIKGIIKKEKVIEPALLIEYGIDLQEEYEKDVKEYLEQNPSELLNVCRSICSYDGNMDFCETWDLNDLCLCSYMNTYDVARAIIYGDVQNVIDEVRYNDYGNLETVTEYELECEATDYIDEILEYLDNCNIDFPNKITNLSKIYDELSAVEDIVDLNEFLECYSDELE